MQGSEALKNKNAVETPEIQSVARPIKSGDIGTEAPTNEDTIEIPEIKSVARKIRPDEIGTESSRALNKFLESAANVGLDNKSEHFRNFTQLMLELKGLDVGVDLSHLVHDEHSGLSMDDTTERKLAKKRKKKWTQEDLDEIERQEAEMMAQLMQSAMGVIDEIQDKLTNEINALNAKIDAEIVQEGEANEAVRSMRKKRNKLRAFKKHIKAHKEELKEADHHDDVIDLQNDVIEDLQDFRAGRFDPQEDVPLKRNALAQAIGDMAKKPNTHKPTTPRSNNNTSGKKETGSGGNASSGNAGTGSASGGETGSGDQGGGGNTDGKNEPPPTPMM